SSLQIALVASAFCCFSVSELNAQNVIGYNASPCPGNCAPGSPYGFFKPHWRQWPGVGYPCTALPKPASEDISPLRVVLPNANKESDIQSQAQPQPRDTGKPSEAAPLPGGPAPDSGDLTNPIKPLDESGGTSPGRELPGTMLPSDQPSLGPT